MRDEMIRRIMTPNPHSISVGSTLADAIDRLNSMTAHHLPVVDNQQLVGMISTSDIVKQIASAQRLQSSATSPLKTSIDSFMIKNPLSIPLSASLRVAAEKLCTGAFHCLPVVDHKHLLVGIVTSTDLIQHLLMAIPTGDGSLKPVSIDALLDRLRMLEAIRQATELYLRTGHGEYEHSVLLEKLAAVSNDSISI